MWAPLFWCRPRLQITFRRRQPHRSNIAQRAWRGCGNVPWLVPKPFQVLRHPRTVVDVKMAIRCQVGSSRVARPRRLLNDELMSASDWISYVSATFAIATSSVASLR
jgi:hypothetical protein